MAAMMSGLFAYKRCLCIGFKALSWKVFRWIMTACSLVLCVWSMRRRFGRPVLRNAASMVLGMHGMLHFGLFFGMPCCAFWDAVLSCYVALDVIKPRLAGCGLRSHWKVQSRAMRQNLFSMGANWSAHIA